jgi:hypothetical protein
MIASCCIRRIAEGGAITNKKLLRIPINGHYGLCPDLSDGVHMIHKQAKSRLHCLAHFLTAVVVTLTGPLGALANSNVASDKTIQSILKVTPSANNDYFRILSARSLGLPDTATSDQIQTAYTHAEFQAEARMCGWPLNLSDTEYCALSERRRKLELAQYGYPEVATDKISQSLLSVKEALMFAPRNLFDSIQVKTPESWCPPIREAVVAYEGACRLFAAKQAAGLLPWASEKELEAMQHERLRTMLVKGLHLKSTASFEEINSAQSKIWKNDHSQLLHRIFKASAEVPDAELENQLKPLALALGYPVLHGTTGAGSRVATADDLLNAALRPSVAPPAHGLAGAPSW